MWKSLVVTMCMQSGHCLCVVLDIWSTYSKGCAPKALGTYPHSVRCVGLDPQLLCLCLCIHTLSCVSQMELRKTCASWAVPQPNNSSVCLLKCYFPCSSQHTIAFQIWFSSCTGRNLLIVSSDLEDPYYSAAGHKLGFAVGVTVHSC